MKTKNLTKHFIFEKDKIKIAVKKLDKLDNKFCLVLGNHKKLLGTITDGDIRRGLLKNYTMNDEVRKIYNKKPFVVKKALSSKQIDNLLKKNYITFIPLINKHKKILKIYDSKNKNNTELINFKMLIMAGGKGLRLRPLTNKIPKPLLLVNKKPIIEHIILAAKNEGITNFYISINYLGYKIKKYLGDGSSLGVRIKYLEEKKPLGTAGSISLIRKFNKPIFVTNADILSKIDFKEMIKYHIKNRSHITIAAKVAYEKDNYGRIISSGSVVKKVIEKLEKSLLINAGIYIVDPRVKKLIKKSRYLDMTDLINLSLSSNNKVNVFPIHEKWFDYGLKKNLNKNLLP
jgi:dTDP-glucose pyrophosphorylase